MAKAKKAPKEGSAAWWKMQPKVVRPLWAEGTELWCVPVRFWEPEDCKPERVRVVTDDGKHSYDGSYNVYAFHYEWGHNAYLDPFDLYPSEAEAIAEAKRRTAAKEAESERDTEKLMASIDQSLRGHDRQRAIFSGISASWAEGDKRDVRRFRDTSRFTIIKKAAK